MSQVEVGKDVEVREVHAVHIAHDQQEILARPLLPALDRIEMRLRHPDRRRRMRYVKPRRQSELLASLAHSQLDVQHRGS